MMSTEQINPCQDHNNPNSTPAESSPGFALASASPPDNQQSIATYVTLVRGTESHPDAQASKMLLDSCRTKDGYKCPRCDFTTTELEAMAYHLTDEINNTMRQLQEYQKSFMPSFKNSTARSRQGNNEATR